MPTVATRCRAIAIIGTLTLGATGCAAGSNDGSGFGASMGTTGEGTGTAPRAPARPTAAPATRRAKTGEPGIERPRLDAEYAQYAARRRGSGHPARWRSSGRRGRRERDVASRCGRPLWKRVCGWKSGNAEHERQREQQDGDVELTASTQTHITSFTTTLTVPAKPTSQSGTLFLWPGLEPLTQSLSSDVGVLQPVLTWGGTCAPGAPNNYDSWWISGQFVTAAGTCAGGPG